jgi:hypothetical protein
MTHQIVIFTLTTLMSLTVGAPVSTRCNPELPSKSDVVLTDNVANLN